MQLCKKLEVGMLLLALFYLFSPLVSVSKTCFFQGVKAGDMIFILVFCLLFVWSWRFAKKESLVFKLSGIDVLLLVCGLYIIVLYLFSWEQLDREVLLMHVACGLLYIAVRILGIQQMHAFSSWEFFEYRYVELFRRLRGYNFMWGNDASFFSCGKDVLWFRGISNRVLAFHGKFTSSMARVCCWRGVFIL